MAYNNKHKGKKNFKYKGKISQNSSTQSYNYKLPFSDDPTLLNIANMNEGKIGFDISVNGFQTTQGNRTFALISVPLEPHNINIDKGLPVYMGAKAVSEVEYPTVDSDLTPASSGDVATDTLSLGRLNTIGYYDAVIKYAYQNCALVVTSNAAGGYNALGLSPLSVTAKSEWNTKVANMITRLQSTVAIEELEFIGLTSAEVVVGSIEDGSPVKANIVGSSQLQFEVQSMLIWMYQRDVMNMASDYLKSAQLIADINHIKHKFPQYSKRLEINYDILKRAKNFTAITKLFDTVTEEYVDLMVWDTQVKPISILSTSKFGVDSPIKAPSVDFALLLGNTNNIHNTVWSPLSTGDYLGATFTVASQEDLNGFADNNNDVKFTYKSGDVTLIWENYQPQFHNLLLNMFLMDYTDFDKYVSARCNYIKNYLATWKANARIVRVALQNLTAMGICNWTRFTTLPILKESHIDNFSMLDDMLQTASLTAPLQESFIEGGERQVKIPVYDDLLKPVPTYLTGQSYSKFWAQSDQRVIIRLNTKVATQDATDYNLLDSFNMLAAPMYYMSQIRIQTNALLVPGTNRLALTFNLKDGNVPRLQVFSGVTITSRVVSQLLRLVPIFVWEPTAGTYETRIHPDLIATTYVRSPDYERMLIDDIRMTGIIQTMGRSN